MLLQADLPISYKNGLTDNRGFIEMATGRCRSNVAARTEESHQDRKTLPNSKKKIICNKTYNSCENLACADVFKQNRIDNKIRNCDCFPARQFVL